jgi:Ca2+-binding EF-hand superfamily protein
MLLRLYCLFLRLYPAGYRAIFGLEMAGVFERADADAWSQGAVRGAIFCVREITGLAFGILRARTRRSEFLEHPATAMAPAVDGVPLFYTCDDYSPRRSALFQGGILSLAFFSLVTAAFEYGVNHRTFRFAAGAAGDTSQSQVIETGDSGFLAFGKSMVSSGDGALVLVLGKQPAIGAIDVQLGAGTWRQAWSNLVWVLKVRPRLRFVAAAAFQSHAGVPASDPVDFAAVYFRAMPVVAALDADHDQVISAAEIANASTVLRSLDSNHDGRLTAEECGGSVVPGSDAESTRRAKLAYMSFHPLLAALDADHDGEISAREIENASAALKTLDRNHDGKLTPDEILPNPGVPIQ